MIVYTEILTKLQKSLPGAIKVNLGKSQDLKSTHIKRNQSYFCRLGMYNQESKILNPIYNSPENLTLRYKSNLTCTQSVSETIK